MKTKVSPLALASILLANDCVAQSDQPATSASATPVLQIDASKVTGNVSPMLYGLMTEDGAAQRINVQISGAKIAPEAEM
jgi:hypothetical protein